MMSPMRRWATMPRVVALCLIGLPLCLIGWLVARSVSDASNLAASRHLEAVAEEVYALVQELREPVPAAEDFPRVQCTPCNTGTKVGGERRKQILDRLDKLGSAAVPTLARMLEGSLQTPNKDLEHTLLWILGELSTGQTDIGAALPALILALDHPDDETLLRAASDIRAIGPKATVAVPKLVALLDDGEWRSGVACMPIRDLEALPALRQQAGLDSFLDRHKQEFAQHAVASIESKCFGADVSGTDATAVIHEGSPCDAPPYGDTPAAYKAFVKPYVSISRGPTKGLLHNACVAKANQRHISVLRFELSDADIDTLGTVALAEKQLVAIVKAPPCQGPRGPAIEGRLCQEYETRHDEPAALFLCFQPYGSCQQIPATPSTPINSLSECYWLALYLSGNRPPYPSPPEMRFVVPGAGAWYECRRQTVHEALKWKLGPVLADGSLNPVEHSN